jgi:NAD(P)-dependent dehydrogenase (short-subunit alcohol dehydrogenase family)
VVYIPLSGRAVLITGASGGIGRETAFAFAREGTRLALTCRDRAEECGRVAERCEELGSPQALAVRLDLGDDASIRACVRLVVDAFKRLSILVNNAGIAVWKPFVEQSFDEIEEQLRVDLEGQLKLTRECLRHLDDAVINIASGAATHPHATLPTYSAAKFGLRGFTKNLALELPGMRAYVVNPRMVRTAMSGYRGTMLPEQVAEVVVRVARGDLDVEPRADVDVEEYV